MSRTIRKYPDNRYICFRRMRTKQLQTICEKYVQELKDNGFQPRGRDLAIANGNRPNSWDDIPIASYGEVKHRLRNNQKAN